MCAPRVNTVHVRTYVSQSELLRTYEAINIHMYQTTDQFELDASAMKAFFTSRNISNGHKIFYH